MVLETRISVGIVANIKTNTTELNIKSLGGKDGKI